MLLLFIKQSVFGSIDLCSDASLTEHMLKELIIIKLPLQVASSPPIWSLKTLYKSSIISN